MTHLNVKLSSQTKLNAWRHRRPIRIFKLKKSPPALRGAWSARHELLNGKFSAHAHVAWVWTSQVAAGLFNRLRPPSEFQSATSRRSELTLTKERNIANLNFFNLKYYCQCVFLICILWRSGWCVDVGVRTLTMMNCYWCTDDELHWDDLRNTLMMKWRCLTCFTRDTVFRINAKEYTSKPTMEYKTGHTQYL